MFESQRHLHEELIAFYIRWLSDSSALAANAQLTTFIGTEGVDNALFSQEARSVAAAGDLNDCSRGLHWLDDLEWCEKRLVLSNQLAALPFVV